MMAQRGLILFAHGSRDPEWAAPFHAIAAALQVARPDDAVTVAFLEGMAPALAEAVAAQVARGTTDITVWPLFLAPGGHIKRDLPALVQAAIARHPGVHIAIAPTIGTLAAVQSAIAAAIISATEEASHA